MAKSKAGRLAMLMDACLAIHWVARLELEKE